MGRYMGKIRGKFYSQYSKGGEYACILQPGMNKEVCIPSTEVPTFSKGDIRALQQTSKYQPLLIQLLCKQPEGAKENVLLIHEQLIFCSFEQQDNERFSLMVNKIAVVFENHEYTVHDLYETNSDEPEGSECVICMTDKPTTTLLPCRHMCLCGECAGLFRTRTEKCPICRVLNLLLTAQ